MLQRGPLATMRAPHTYFFRNPSTHLEALGCSKNIFLAEPLRYDPYKCFETIKQRYLEGTLEPTGAPSNSASDRELSLRQSPIQSPSMQSPVEEVIRKVPQVTCSSISLNHGGEHVSESGVGHALVLPSCSLEF